MSRRPDLPHIRPKEEPSLMNPTAGKWGLVGAVTVPFLALLEFLPAIAFFKGKTAYGLSAVGLAAGTVLGGLAGKSRTQRELENGRTVQDPSYINEGMASGVAVSAAVHLPLLLAGKKIAYKWSVPLTLGAALIGSVMRKSSLQDDFDRAVGARDAENQALAAQAKAQELIRGYKNTTTPADLAAMAARQQQPAHGDAVLQDRALAANENSR